MEYHKGVSKKPGRVTQMKGPRDYQRDQNNDSLVVELRKQINKLERKLKSVDNKKQFTAEQMDAEIRDAAKSAIEETSIRYKKKIKILESELEVVEEKLKLKEEMIEILKSKVVLKEEDLIVEKDRPKMKNVFVDPLDRKAEDGLVSYIDVENISMDEKENIQEKVDKLKLLLGNLEK